MENVPQILPNTRVSSEPTFTGPLADRSCSSIVGSCSRSRWTLAANSSLSFRSRRSWAFWRARARFWRARLPARSDMRGHSAPTSTTTAAASKAMKSQLTTTILDTGAACHGPASLALVAVLAVAFWPSGAVARSGEQTLVFRSAAITVQGYGVEQGMQLVPSPSVDGYVTGISADVVDENGVSMPISTVMLHHVVLAKLGAPDATCQQFYGYDGRSVGLPVERFFAEGEERTTIQLPAGYGYPNRGSDRWGLVYMLMNHKPTTFTAYVQYTVHYVTGEQRHAREARTGST